MILEKTISAKKQILVKDVLEGVVLKKMILKIWWHFIIYFTFYISDFKRKLFQAILDYTEKLGKILVEVKKTGNTDPLKKLIEDYENGEFEEEKVSNAYCLIS